ncbi:MAG: membrane protein insertion efficiency factor YidD [Phycisphaerae bacterium]|nr:membrane protein insertion efficiency factor YidD [Phycisphaerae bacterium]
MEFEQADQLHWSQRAWFVNDLPHSTMIDGNESLIRRAAMHAVRGLRGAAVFVIVLAIRAYQVGVRPLLVGSCKYHPHCSEYAVEAFRRHGPLRGGWLALRRLLRCHPWAAGGYDPIP